MYLVPLTFFLNAGPPPWAIYSGWFGVALVEILQILLHGCRVSLAGLVGQEAFGHGRRLAGPPLELIGRCR